MALGQMLQPSGRDRADPVRGAEQRPGDRGVRVGIAAEADHVPKTFLEAELFTGDLEGDPDGEQREPLVRTIDLTRPASLAHEELELLGALAVRQDREAVQNGGI